MSPFTYPARPHVRRHGPQGYAQATSYRPWLRDEFSFRCVYCLIREQWGRVASMFDLDHFLPAARHPDEIGTYDNLLYSCATCNAAKGDGVVPDPCRVLVNGDVVVRADGVLEARTQEARRLVRILGLDDPRVTDFRLLWIGIVALAKQFDSGLYQRLMSFPPDLPNLRRLRPPAGNSRPEGVATSFHAQRSAGTLSATY